MYTLDLYNNTKVLKRILLSEFIVSLVFIVLSYKWSLAMTVLNEENFFANITVGLCGLCILIIIHESIRTILFKLIYKASKSHIQFKSGILIHYLPKIQMSRMTFTTIMLLPIVLINMLLFIFFINMTNTYIIFVFAFHMGYSTLAMYLVFLALSNQRVQTIEMTEIGLVLRSESSTLNHNHQQ